MQCVAFHSNSLNWSAYICADHPFSEQHFWCIQPNWTYWDFSVLLATYYKILKISDKLEENSKGDTIFKYIAVFQTFRSLCSASRFAASHRKSRDQEPRDHTPSSQWRCTTLGGTSGSSTRRWGSFCFQVVWYNWLKKSGKARHFKRQGEGSNIMVRH